MLMKIEASSVNEKILTAMERLAHMLRSLLWEMSKELNLSPIQIHFLIYLSTHPRELRRVSRLAQEFELSQATVSDAVKVLIEKKLIEKVPHEGDRRVAVLELTPKGNQIVSRLSEWNDPVNRVLDTLPQKNRERALVFLMKFIAGLQNQNVITPAHMCVTCEYFQPNSTDDRSFPHFCAFTKTPMRVADLKIDCDFHREHSDPRVLIRRLKRKL